jgi:hypothetical protein
MRLLAPEHFSCYLSGQVEIACKLGLSGNLLQSINATGI